MAAIKTAADQNRAALGPIAILVNITSCSVQIGSPAQCHCVSSEGGLMGVLGRMAQPEVVAAMALFFVSDQASITTGANFNNDGGWTAMRGISVQPVQQ
jgi:enoyl-[acyl-carrier-protein] reductase (NADH)